MVTMRILTVRFSWFTTWCFWSKLSLHDVHVVTTRFLLVPPSLFYVFSGLMVRTLMVIKRFLLVSTLYPPPKMDLLVLMVRNTWSLRDLSFCQFYNPPPPREGSLGSHREKSHGHQDITLGVNFTSPPSQDGSLGSHSEKSHDYQEISLGANVTIPPPPTRWFSC